MGTLASWSKSVILRSKYCNSKVEKIKKGMYWIQVHTLFKDTHREKAHPNKTPVLMKSMYMDIRVVGTSNQLFIRVS